MSARSRTRGGSYVRGWRRRVRHRERVLTALQHEIPDRCPMQISFTPEFADRLRADLRPTGLRSPAAVRPARRRQHQRTGTRHRRGHAAHVGRLGRTRYYQGEGRVHRRVGRDMPGSAVRNPLRHGQSTPRSIGHPLADDARDRLATGRRTRTAPSSTRRPERVIRGFGAEYLDRRRDGHDDLGDRLGAARLRAAA